jgi:hypothetical protein
VTRGGSSRGWGRELGVVVSAASAIAVVVVLILEDALVRA